MAIHFDTARILGELGHHHRIEPDEIDVARAAMVDGLVTIHIEAAYSWAVTTAKGVDALNDYEDGGMFATVGKGGK